MSFRALLCFAVWALLSNPLSASEPTPAAPTGQTAGLNALLQAYHDVYGVSGALRVSQGEQLLFEQAIGLAERSFEQSYTPATRQPINSISKLFTAVAALRMVQAGKLDLHAPVAEYLPDFAAPWAKRVTAHHLLSHSSGLPREAGLATESSLNFDQQLEIVAGLSLGFEPGTEQEYSNVGFIVLGALLEELGGQPFPEIIQAEVLAPLSLGNTGVLQGRRVVARQAVPYSMTASGIEQAQRTKTLGASAGGGLYSNGADLHTLMHALRGDSLLNAAMRQRLSRVNMPAGGEVGEAYAMSIQAFGDKTIWLVAGSGYGAKSVLIHVPEDGLVVSILSNWGNTPIMPMLRDVYLTLQGQQVALPDRDGLASVEVFADHLGVYQFDEQALRQALQADDGLMRLHESDGRLFLDDELMANGDGPKQLRLTYTDELIVNLEADAMVIQIGGQSLRGQRLPR
jgi:CubicO group peptidase (beta-lactamase class C family)